MSSAFLNGARLWLFDGQAPGVCPACGFDWGTSPLVAVSLIEQCPARVAELLAGRDGMAAGPDGTWNATAYVWHLTDLARGWTERWVQLAAAPGSLLVPWDPDVLAEARNYRQLPTSAALWAIGDSVTTLIARTATLSLDTPFAHGDWGPGCVGDALVWLAHEFVHHELDVSVRAVAPPAAD